MFGEIKMFKDFQQINNCCAQMSTGHQVQRSRLQRWTLPALPEGGRGRHSAAISCSSWKKHSAMESTWPDFDEFKWPRTSVLRRNRSKSGSRTAASRTSDISAAYSSWTCMPRFQVFDMGRHAWQAVGRWCASKTRYTVDAAASKTTLREQRFD